MTDTMLTRMARAMRYAKSPHDDLPMIDELGSEEVLVLAKAALEAIREPSVGVARAIGSAAWHSGSGQRPENVWRAGVLAILQGEA